MLLHLITAPEWRAALAAGAVRPTVAEFVHLSTPEQVALPAEYLFAGRRDVCLLVIDPARVPAEIRWEPGTRDEPPSMRFPHVYGPVPTSAVLAVLPYRPPFTAPPLPPLDAAGRILTLDGSVARRAATSEVPVTGGVAVLTPALPESYQHNMLIIDGGTDLATLLADADRALAGFAHRQVRLLGVGRAPLASGLAAEGWTVTGLAVMAAPASGEPTGRAEQLDRAALRPFRADVWRRDLPGLAEDEYRQLLDRDALTEAVTDVRRLAVRDGADGASAGRSASARDAIVAGADLLIDGATAYLDAVQTLPAHRGRGHGDALVADALAVAAGAGCDLVGLDADLADWPLGWYARRGFAEVGRAWLATRPIGGGAAPSP